MFLLGNHFSANKHFPRKFLYGSHDVQSPVFLSPIPEKEKKIYVFQNICCKLI
jgi:hypothetical protein